MQVVSRACIYCGERIGVEKGAGGCDDCDIAFHIRCAKRQAGAKTAASTCPRCGQRYRARAAADERSHQEAHAAEVRRGARIAWVIAAALVTTSLLSLAPMLARDEPPFPVFGRIAASLMLGGLLVRGARSARLLTIAGCLLAVAYSLIAIARGLPPGTFAAVVALDLVQLASAGALAVSPSVRAFIQSRNPY